MKNKKPTIYTCECGRSFNPAQWLGNRRAKALGKKRVLEIAKKASIAGHKKLLTGKLLPTARW